MEEKEAVEHAWRDYPVVSYTLVYPIHNVRYVVRDGKPVLQKKVLVKVKLGRDIFRNQRLTDEDSDFVWFDVAAEEG